MRAYPLVKRYAKALFELAAEQNQVNDIIEQARVFGKLYRENHDFNFFLISPEIDKALKIQVIEALFFERVSALFYHFLLLLIKKGRQNLTPQLVVELNRLYDLYQNRLRARVTLAKPLDKTERLLLVKKLNDLFDSNIVLEQVVDTSIVGGMVIQIKGKVYDMSLLKQLNTLKRQLKSVEDS